MILVVGASGRLGTAIVERAGDDVVPVTSHELDLAEPSGIGAFLDRYRPVALINCAAYAAVDLAETEEEHARAVNALAVGEMAAWAGRREIPFMTFSTDFVFDGASGRPYLEDDPPAPLNAYGRTKWEGEVLALVHPGSLVVRTSWLVSGTHESFVSTVLRRALQGTVRVVDDQTGSPTIAGDLAAASLDALRDGVTGLLHLANRGAATRFELARTAVELAGLDAATVEPCHSAEQPSRAARPAYSVLGSSRAAALGLVLPDWRDSLPAVVARLRSWVGVDGDGDQAPVQVSGE